jgi:hypothetical protein
LSSAAVVLSERKHQLLVGKKWHAIMLWWSGGNGKENLQCPAWWMPLSIETAGMQQQTSSTVTLSSVWVWHAESCHILLLCVFLSPHSYVRFIEWIVESSIMKIKQIYHVEARSCNSIK